MAFKNKRLHGFIYTLKFTEHKALDFMFEQVKQQAIETSELSPSGRKLGEGNPS
jgi:hypothetical protein